MPRSFFLKTFCAAATGAFLLLAALPVGGLPQARAARIDELNNLIGEKQSEIRSLEAEIAGYQLQIDQNVSQGKTLKAEIARLEAKIKKLNADVRLTQRKIDAAELTIEKISTEIGEKKRDIFSRHEMLAEILKTIYQTEADSVVEVMLKHKEFSDFFNDMEYIGSLESSVEYDLETLKILKADLEERQGLAEDQKKRLTALEREFLDRKTLEENTQKGKNQLLAVTKNKETEYQKLLKDREAKRAEIVEEIRRVEDELKKLIDPASLPEPKRGVLAWPVKNPKITQRFGLSSFSTGRTDVYKNGRHNGVDLAASIGTALYAAEDATVRASGNNDIGCPGGSYGKWILLVHPNNLATLYAHISIIKVQPGAELKRGDLIAYSGDTGYTTGPHLHFAVYDSRTIELRPQRSCGITPFGGYLDPMLYL